MSTYNHTDISSGAAANASTVNTPLGTLDAAIGNLSSLTTTAKSSAVAAVNEVDANADAAAAAVGTLASLTTTAKGSAVAAINELDADVGTPASLTTTAKSTLVAAINELDGEHGNLASLTTVAKSTLVAAINEVAGGWNVGPSYLIGLNGAYTTVSAALAAISDASASKIYTLIVYGAIAEVATVTPKSYVNVLGMPGASITVTIDGAGYGFDFNNVSNTTWRGLTLTRAGAVSSGVTTVLVRGSCDTTVRFENCVINHTCTGTGSDGYAFYVADSATPYLADCTIAAGGTGNNGIGVLVSPSGAITAHRCHITGGSGGTGCHGVYISLAAYADFFNCTIVGGSGGANSYGLRADGRQCKLEHCTVIGGSGGTGCSAIAIGNAGTILASQTTTDVNIERVTTAAISATDTACLQASKPHQLQDLIINCTAAASGGRTVSIGTTLGGTDIVNAFAVSSTGRKYPALGSGAKALLAAAADLYITVSGGGTATFTLETTIAISYATCYGLYLNGTNNGAGAVRINNCTILSNCASTACYVDANTIAANRLVAQNSIFRPYPALTSSPVAVTGASQWWQAPFYNCVFDGGASNIRPATPVDNGSNVEVQATLTTSHERADAWDYYLRRWRIQLAKVLAASAGENAIAVLLGDSWTYDDYIGSVLRDKLQLAYGDGGGGFISAFAGPPTWGSLANSKSNFTTVDVTTPATAYGVDGHHIISTNASATWEMSGDAFDEAIIHYIKHSGGGTFRYKVGVGGSWNTVATDDATTQFASVTVATGGSALYFDIDSQGAGCIICGVDWRISGNAVRLHRVGNGGIKASQYVSLDETIWKAGLAALQPDLVLIMLGTNEMDQDVAPATMASNMSTLIARVRAAVSPSPDIVLIAPADNGSVTPTYTMPQYVEELRHTARVEGCGFLSLYELLGVYDASWIGEIYYNALHPNQVGARVIANALYKLLTV